MYSNLRICDVACGQGHLSRRLAEYADVTGVDISASLLELAKQIQAHSLRIEYILDDAQSLSKLEDETFDAVVINMALMDIPNHKSTFDNCHRILKREGIFVFSILHPCFESPFDANNPPIELSPNGDFLACRVNRYLEEGHWKSGGSGVRGRVGAYHRTISTYLNDLISSGFAVQAVYEPALQEDSYTSIEEQWFSKVPKGLVIRSCKM